MNGMRISGKKRFSRASEKDGAAVFLDLRKPPEFCGCAFRCFEAGERHITRKCDYGVLLLAGGRAAFSEDGSAVELHSGQWYLQRPGLYQEGARSQRQSRYFLHSFFGSFGEEIPPDSQLALSGVFLRLR